MIVLLLSYSNSWCQTNKDVSSSTGKQDTSVVTVPVSFIKDANAKLIERLALLKITAHQDSIINLNRLYKAEQESIIKGFQGKVHNLNEANVKLVNQVQTERKRNVIYKGVTAGTIVVAILSFILK